MSTSATAPTQARQRPQAVTVPAGVTRATAKSDEHRRQVNPLAI